MENILSCVSEQCCFVNARMADLHPTSTLYSLLPMLQSVDNVYICMNHEIIHVCEASNDRCLNCEGRCYISRNKIHDCNLHDFKGSGQKPIKQYFIKNQLFEQVFTPHRFAVCMDEVVNSLPGIELKEHCLNSITQRLYALFHANVDHNKEMHSCHEKFNAMWSLCKEELNTISTFKDISSCSENFSSYSRILNSDFALDIIKLIAADLSQNVNSLMPFSQEFSIRKK